MVLILVGFRRADLKEVFILSPDPLEKAQIYFQGELSELYDQTLILENYAKDYHDDLKGVLKLKLKVRDLRHQYKKVEFLTDYFNPSFCNKYINGAPLPKLLENVPEISVIDPRGLQTIDEMVYLDEENKDGILDLSRSLAKDMELLVTFQKKKQIQYRYIFEALRNGLIRVYTLGLTGFDTPGSGDGIDEAITSIKSMKEVFSFCQPLATQSNMFLFKEILDLFDQTIIILEESEVDSLNRLTILKDYFNPLIKKLLAFHGATRVEKIHEVDPTIKAVKYESDNLFSDQFLNASFYTQIANSDLYDQKKIKLGELLFYDKRLSNNSVMSCATCHNPRKGFTDGLPKSKTNTEGIFTQRNSPTLLNSAYSTRYFWDLREYDLERQIKHVTLEFNVDFIELAENLKESEVYLALFKDAYGERDKYEISTWSISNSLAAYVNSLSGFNSEFDRYVRGEIKTIDHSTENGYNLFMGKAGCGTCHFAPTFNGIVPPYYKETESEVLGVTVSFDTINPILDNDPGRINNGLPEEAAEHFYQSMKTVTVRNVELTAPYMHNGGFKTLEEVVEFNNRGGGQGLGLTVPFQTLPSDNLNLSEKEKSDIVQFMRSLTDTSMVKPQPTSFPEFRTLEK